MADDGGLEVLEHVRLAVDGAGPDVGPHQTLREVKDEQAISSDGSPSRTWRRARGEPSSPSCVRPGSHVRAATSDVHGDTSCRRRSRDRHSSALRGDLSCSQRKGSRITYPWTRRNPRGKRLLRLNAEGEERRACVSGR